jgi:hypothetical protein
MQVPPLLHRHGSLAQSSSSHKDRGATPSMETDVEDVADASALSTREAALAALSARRDEATRWPALSSTLSLVLAILRYMDRDRSTSRNPSPHCGSHVQEKYHATHLV